MASTPCYHQSLTFLSSPYGTESGFRRPTAQQRLAATTSRGVVSTQKAKRRKTEVVADDFDSDNPSSFPAPLLLPGDDLSLDPGYPPQSLRAWLRLKDRNEVMSTRRTIYVAAPPTADSSVDFVRTWVQPAAENRAGPVESPRIEVIIEYLRAVYHGMSVKALPFDLSFVEWDTPPKKGAKSKSASQNSLSLPRHIGLTSSTECVRIRTRVPSNQLFPRQLNLDDLLDAAIGMLPSDAYALLMLVDHDLYEGPEDEFVCGRAYGGSRVAVVSTARYNPVLDSLQGIERDHSWPASHCETYVHSLCKITTSRKTGSPEKGQNTSTEQPARSLPASPMSAALSAYQALPILSFSSTLSSLQGLWLGRACRTASHELGHCFGLDHCLYYACVMQGSASLPEDARQPPYLCPVDLEKVLRATGSTTRGQYDALVRFCEGHAENHLFAALGAWVRVRLESLSP